MLYNNIFVNIKILKLFLFCNLYIKYFYVKIGYKKLIKKKNTSFMHMFFDYKKNL